MKLAVVILNWNNAPDTVACATRVIAWRRLRPQVWVVDNASADGSAEIIADLCPEAHLLSAPTNLGFGGGNNLAIEKARNEGSDAILLLNNDAVIQEEDVARLLQVLHEHPSAGIVGPYIRETYDDRTFYSLGGRSIVLDYDTRITSAELPCVEAGSQPVEYVPGTAVLIRGELFDRVSLFDEDYFFSGEMADLCLRARAEGYQALVVPSACAEHRDEAGERRHTLYAYYSLRNRFLFVRKHAGPWQTVRWTGRGIHLVLRQLRKRHIVRARCHWLALIDGLSGRYGDQHERVQRN